MGAVLKLPKRVKTAEELAKEHFKLIGMKRGKLPGFEVGGGNVLLMVYQRPEKSPGGILYTDKTKDEEKNQGKACLVVAMGPTAFVSDKNYDFAGFRVDVGQWVQIYVYETKPVTVHSHACRWIVDTAIRTTIPHPDVIY